MTTVDSSLPAAADAANSAKSNAAARAALWLARAEEFLDYLGDFLNPILVKEARQAMKSRQFSITFSLLLVLGWLWTVGFIAWNNQTLYYTPRGVAALSVYYLVLTIPMLIVIPFATFRSLAGENEDGTFELMSITTLSARQIIVGKLASAMLQMMVYYSALAPCIAFTYLLKGVDIVTIAMLLFYTFLASMLLSIVGLVAATLTRQRMFQVLVSVLLIMGLMFFTFVWDWSVVGGLLVEAGGILPYDEEYFWAVNAAIVSFAVALGVLFTFVAAAQITFASENRSTPIRWVLVAIHLLIIGWMVFLWRVVPDNDAYIALDLMEYFAAAFWMFTGAVLTGETAELSPRAKRHLPQSLLGRATLTWFNPGSGSGYTFVVVNMASVLVVHSAAVAVAWMISDERAPDDWTWFFTGLCLTGYIAAYLGVVRLFVSVARRFVAVNMLTAFLLNVVLALAGILIPLLVLSLSTAGNWSDFIYSPLQMTNWAWTLYELADNGVSGSLVGPYVPLIILFLGGVIFVANLYDTAEEVEKVRTAAPQRVLLDDLARKRPALPQRRNPWDEPAADSAASGEA
jgi:hypothetical protein